jgi:hypothetical protein
MVQEKETIKLTASRREHSARTKFAVCAAQDFCRVLSITFKANRNQFNSKDIRLKCYCAATRVKT